MKKMVLRALVIVLMASGLQVNQVKADDTGAIAGGVIGGLLIIGIASAILYFHKNPGEWEGLKNLLKDKYTETDQMIDQQPGVSETQKNNEKGVSRKVFNSLDSSASRKSSSFDEDAVSAAGVVYGGDISRGAQALKNSRPLQGSENAPARSNMDKAKQNLLKMKETEKRSQKLEEHSKALDLDAIKIKGRMKADADSTLGIASDNDKKLGEISALKDVLTRTDITNADKKAIREEIVNLKIDAAKTFPRTLFRKDKDIAIDRVKNLSQIDLTDIGITSKDQAKFQEQIQNQAREIHETYVQPKTGVEFDPDIIQPFKPIAERAVYQPTREL